MENYINIKLTKESLYGELYQHKLTKEPRNKFYYFIILYRNLAIYELNFQHITKYSI